MAGRGKKIEFVSVKHNGVIQIIAIADITYIVCDGGICDIFLYNGEKYIKLKLLKEFEEELHGYGFIRIHHNTLLNHKYIRSINNKTHKITLTTNAELKVSIRKWKAVKQQLQNDTYL